MAAWVQARHDLAQRRQGGVTVIAQFLWGLVQLIPAAPDGQGRMVAAADHRGLGIARQEADELGIVGRHIIHARAGLDKLLPDQDAQPITEPVKGFFFDQPAAPYPQQVDVGILRQPQQPLKLLGLFDTVQHIQRDPVPALDVQPSPVDHQVIRQRIRRGIFIVDKFHAPDAEGDYLYIRKIIIRKNARLHLVERLLARAVRPPQRGPFDTERFRSSRSTCWYSKLRARQSLARPFSPEGERDPRVTLRRFVHLHGHGNFGTLIVIKQVGNHVHIRDARRAVDAQVYIFPDAQMHQSRAKIPPVVHARLLRGHPAGVANLRLLERRGINYHCQQVLAAEVQQAANLEGDRQEHARVLPQRLAVEEKARRIIHAAKDQLDPFVV